MQAILDALHFDSIAFLIQVVLFITLLLVMNGLFWKPIMAHLALRDKEKADAHRKVETTEQEMEALRADYLTRITQIEAEARAHIQVAIKEAQSERERIMTEARMQTEALLKQGIAAMEREKTEALISLQSRMVGIASSAADKALGSFGDQAALRQSIETRIMQHTPSLSKTFPS